MDAILFYGEKDEATRRQVRSAAAQHSHRIGPRKPKASKRPRADSGTSRRRNLQKATAIAVAPVAPGSAGKLTPTTKPVPSPTRPTTSTSSQPSVATSRGSPMTDQEGEMRPAAIAQWEHQVPPFSRAQSSSSSSQHSVSHPPGLSLQVPAPPPLSIDRIDRPPEDRSRASHTRSNSQLNEKSPTMRLPQYSWTEYPRYGLGHNTVNRTPLQMLAQVSRERETGAALSPLSNGNPNRPTNP